jgi:hypothetical protein
MDDIIKIPLKQVFILILAFVIGYQFGKTVRKPKNYSLGQPLEKCSSDEKENRNVELDTDNQILKN